MTSFSMRSAKSGAFISVIAVAVMIETTGLHVILARHHGDVSPKPGRGYDRDRRKKT